MDVSSRVDSLCASDCPALSARRQRSSRAAWIRQGGVSIGSIKAELETQKRPAGEIASDVSVHLLVSLCAPAVAVTATLPVLSLDATARDWRTHAIGIVRRGTPLSNTISRRAFASISQSLRCCCSFLSFAFLLSSPFAFPPHSSSALPARSSERGNGLAGSSDARPPVHKLDQTPSNNTIKKQISNTHTKRAPNPPDQHPISSRLVRQGRSLRPPSDPATTLSPLSPRPV